MARKNIKIVLTGGHAATTALATIEALQEDNNINWIISWIGTSRAVEGSKTLTLEFKIFPGYGIKCYEIVAGRLQRRWTRYSLISALRIPFGLAHAFWLLLKLKPKVIISFGGFAAFPVVVAANFLGIPVIVHEQTIAAGLTNRLSSFFATKVALARSESKKYFPTRKTVLIGNPVREAFFKIPKTTVHKPIIYATGGSRGSQVFNEKLLEILPKLLPNFQIIHQTGDLDLKKCLAYKKTLSKNLSEKYEVFGTVDPLKVPEIFSKASIVIGRAGANTVAEVIASQKASVFIPIPWSQHDEQRKNAELAAKSGISEILDQDTLTSELFFDTIMEVYKKVKKNFKIKNNEIYQLDRLAAGKLSELAASLMK